MKACSQRHFMERLKTMDIFVPRRVWMPGNKEYAIGNQKKPLWKRCLKGAIMTERKQQRIEAVAVAMLHVWPEPGETLEDVAKNINNGDGWSFDLPVADRPDNWLRCEGVKLSAEDLQEAITMAKSIIEQEKP